MTRKADNLIPHGQEKRKGRKEALEWEGSRIRVPYIRLGPNAPNSWNLYPTVLISTWLSFFSAGVMEHLPKQSSWSVGELASTFYATSNVS
jgi:hypothetical protein